MTAAVPRAAASRRRRALRALAIALTVVAAIPIGLFLLAASVVGERR